MEIVQSPYSNNTHKYSLSHTICCSAKRLGLTLCLLGLIQMGFSQLRITAFSPLSGPVGTTVTIYGNLFSVIPANNTVFVGGVKATVLTANSSVLTIQVPSGTGNSPISVTANGLTAHAPTAFLTTFPAGGGVVSRYSFDTARSEATDLHPNAVAICDLDGDGKLDVATANNYSSAGNSSASFSVLRNTSISSMPPSFAPKVDFANGLGTYAIAAGDVNGDGKPDIIVSSTFDNNISVFKNTSVPGNISFAPKIDYPTNSAAYSIAVRDLDGDGKPEITVSNYFAGTLSIYRNIGNTSAVSFATATTVTTNQGPRGIYIADIDGDFIPDLAVANELSSTVSVFRNTSISGSLSFDPAKNYILATGPYSVALGDLNGDGRPDMAAAGGTKVGVYKNASTYGNINFIDRADYNTGASASHVAMSDLNGDGKVDILVTAANITAHRNTSTAGTLSLAAPEYLWLTSGIPSFMTEAGDLNGDSRPDLVSAVNNLEKVLIHRNKLTEPHITSCLPSPAASGTTVTISGEYFTGATAVSFGGVPAASFSVVNDNTITAVVGAGHSGNVTVVTPKGTDNMAGFIFAGPPVITSFSPTAAARGQEVIITGHNFNNVTSVKLGASSANFTTLSHSSIKAIVGFGSTGKVYVTTLNGTDSLAGFTYLVLPIINSFSPTQAAQGTTINITGENFTGVTGVSFGGVPATSFTIVSATTITAVVPANATSGDITITNMDGATSKPGFIFFPAPTITVFSPAIGIPGTVVTVTGTNFSNISAVTVGGVSYTATYTLVSPTTITIPLNNSGASGNIVITTNGGTATMPGFVFYGAPKCNEITPVVANTGMEVTITGLNFYQVSQVSLGGEPVASFTVLSPTTIKAIVGNGISGVVTVTTVVGTNNTGPSFVFSNAPLITTWSPKSGPVGTWVTINGGGFNPTAANNLVHFGTVKANVINATGNSLTVQVPNGATYNGISVVNTDNNTAGFSDIPFNVTFPADTANFNSHFFGGKFTIPTAANVIANTTGDIDGDGKQDIVVVYKNGDFISIFRNTTTNTQLSFAPRVDIPVDSRVSNVLLGDLNNDGKTDIICNNGSFNGTAAILIGIKNNSTPGNISFANYFFISNYESDVVTTGDFNGDGKLDIAVTSLPRTSGGSGSPNTRIRVDIYPNTSTGSNISFGSYLPVYSNTISTYESVFHTDITARDVNNDNKPDIILGTSGNFFVIFRNIGNGTYNFSPSIIGNFSEPDYQKSKVSIADFDQDGYMDIITTHHIHRNLGNLSFATTLNQNIGNVRAVADLDGDGRPDFVKTPSYVDSFSYIIKNRSTVGSIAFAPAYVNKVKWLNWSPNVADLSNDGRPEIIYVSYNADSIVILKNETGAGVLCAGGSTVFLSSIESGTTFQWQVNTGSGFVNITDNANYSGTQMAALQLNNIPTNWYGYQYRCVVDGNNSAVHTLQFSNTWIGAVSTNWENPANWSCGIVPDTNTDVIIASGTITLGTSTIIRSLQLSAGVNFTVTPGTVLTILH